MHLKVVKDDPKKTNGNTEKRLFYRSTSLSVLIFQLVLHEFDNKKANLIPTNWYESISDQGIRHLQLHRKGTSDQE